MTVAASDVPDPFDLDDDEKSEILQEIQEILWKEGRDFNPDKEWDSGTIELVADAMQRLRPDDG